MTYPEISPIIFQIGPLAVRWYGLMYLIGFGFAYWLLRRRAEQRDDWTAKDVEDLIFYGAIGVIVGGRLGYVFFYQFGEFLKDPLYLFKLTQGGMSFHGGLVGVLAAIGWFARKQSRAFFDVADYLVPGVPLGLLFGRIGNFINGELWGKPTTVPWGFDVYGQRLHASQLYEAFLEGLVLFIVLWFFTTKSRPRMAASGLFLFLYGVFRFAVEFVRVPDEHLKYLALDWVTMGQVLSTPMIIAGLMLMFLAYRKSADVSSGVST
ncbi:MAG: prolipoprotein diacylglyceryl transferase [Gammaproteobacteria bacterium]